MYAHKEEWRERERHVRTQGGMEGERACTHTRRNEGRERHVHTQGGMEGERRDDVKDE